GQPYSLTSQLADALGMPWLLFDDAAEAARQTRRGEQELRTQIERFAGDRPLLLVAEDLHWSDQPSLQILLGLVQRPVRTLVLLTCRKEPLQPALAGFLAELTRLRSPREIEIRALGRPEVARMVRAILGLDEPISSALLDEVMNATEGVPFLVE